MPSNLLTPVLALVAWTLIIWVWMYATRLPAMSAAKLDPQAARFPGSLDILPDSARQVADNYNHLMEQPTVFYALVFYIYLAGRVDQTSVWLAWTYVLLRIVHSLVQCTINRVTLRFAIFALSTLALMIMTVREFLPFFWGLIVR